MVSKDLKPGKIQINSRGCLKRCCGPCKEEEYRTNKFSFVKRVRKLIRKAITKGLDKNGRLKKILKRSVATLIWTKSSRTIYTKNNNRIREYHYGSSRTV